MSGKKDLLVPVRNLLSSSEKWIKGAYRRDGKYCIVGALETVYDHVEPYSKLYNELCERAACDNTSLSEWNDRRDRKFEDVVELLREPIYG